MNLNDYMEQVGRGGLVWLAKEIGVRPPVAFRWVHNQSQVPAERCPEIERITKGAVTCEELRPDVNWGVLRGSGRKRKAKA